MMYLKDSILEHYGNFEIRPTEITFHTLDKRNIMLPYSGPLPVQFEGTVNPYIFMSVRPGDVRMVLFAKKGGKRLHASIEATAKEIDDVLFRFFYKGVSNNRHYTRFDNGLDQYWLGHYQAEYNLWKRITLEDYMSSVVCCLPDDKRARLMTWLQLMERGQLESVNV